jgi:hypothetical protein
VLAVSNFFGGSVTSTKAQRIMVGPVLMLLTDGFGGFGGNRRNSTETSCKPSIHLLPKECTRFRS